MHAEDDYHEYLDEIRRTVCSRCVERPAGGPPCGPLGKPCGVEMHLPQLINSVHRVRSDWLGPYVDGNREAICSWCPSRKDSHHCPCPMETLIALIVPAVEAVDRRRRQREQEEWGRLGILWDE
jgi:hypothetical protein